MRVNRATAACTLAGVSMRSNQFFNLAKKNAMTESSKNLLRLNAQLTETQETIKFLLYKLGGKGGNSAPPSHLRWNSSELLDLADSGHRNELYEICNDVSDSLGYCQGFANRIHVDRNWPKRHPCKRIAELHTHVSELRKKACDYMTHGESHEEYKQTAQKLIKQIAAETKQALDEIVELENIVN